MPLPFSLETSSSCLVDEPCASLLREDRPRGGIPVRDDFDDFIFVDADTRSPNFGVCNLVAIEGQAWRVKPQG
jgi:hypothetical protein